jgi:hypothetical protein
MTQLFANNAKSHLVSALAAADDVLHVASAAGFPAFSNEEDFFLVTLVEKNETGREIAWEIVKVVSVTGDDLCVERAQEGTAARDWPEETPVELRLTAGALDDFMALVPLIYAGL